MKYNKKQQQRQKCHQYSCREENSCYSPSSINVKCFYILFQQKLFLWVLDLLLMTHLSSFCSQVRNCFNRRRFVFHFVSRTRFICAPQSTPLFPFAFCVKTLKRTFGREYKWVAIAETSDGVRSGHCSFIQETDGEKERSWPAPFFESRDSKITPSLSGHRGD